MTNNAQRLRRRFSAGLLATCLLAVTACGSDADDSGAAAGDGEPIKVAALLALTSAAGASVAEAARLGAELAAEHINAEGGIDGREVELIVSDTEMNPTTATSEYTRLVSQEDVELILGPMYSQETMAVLPMAARDGVFQVHPTAADDITPDIAPYSFGVLANASSQVELMVDFALEEHSPTRVALVHDPGAQALTAAEAFTTLLEEQGVEVVADVEHEYGEADMTPALLEATRHDPDLIFAYDSLGSDVGGHLQARTELGLQDIPLVGNYTYAVFVDEALAFVDEAAFENVTGLNYLAFSFCEGQEPEGGAADFHEGFQEAFPDAGDELGLQYASLLYDSLYVMKAAVEGTDGATDGEALADWMINADDAAKVNTGWSADEDDHFLVGPDDMRVVLPVTRDNAGLQQAINC